MPLAASHLYQNWSQLYKHTNTCTCHPSLLGFPHLWFPWAGSISGHPFSLLPVLTGTCSLPLLLPDSLQLVVTAICLGISVRLDCLMALVTHSWCDDTSSCLSYCVAWCLVAFPWMVVHGRMGEGIEFSCSPLLLLCISAITGEKKSNHFETNFSSVEMVETAGLWVPRISGQITVLCDKRAQNFLEKWVLGC